jgi:mannitol/fructose-specific phosphotransferase system IIA component (Ntr-type)
VSRQKTTPRAALGRRAAHHFGQQIRAGPVSVSAFRRALNLHEERVMHRFGLPIDKAAVRIFPNGISKHDALDRLIEAVNAVGAITNLDAFARAVRERETVMSTGIGCGVAIPHVRIDGVTKPTVGVGISHQGIEFNTLDDKPVHIVVLFAMPTGSQKEYLGLLAQVMTAMKEIGFREELGACQTADEVVALLNDPAM